MNLIIVLAGLGLFGFVACNIGSNDSKRGYESYGWKPALYVVLACVIGWLLWPIVGPFVSALLFHLGGVQ